MADSHAKQEIQNLVNGYEVVIGLEVHAQISSKAKLFSGSSTEFGSEPNHNVDFVDSAMPGMLPVLNQYCVDQAIKTGFGVAGTIHRRSVFDRKNYFYPDLPQGYQITQLYHPIITDGKIEISLPDGSQKTINIDRIHIEQDAGKSVHTLEQDKTYIDLNRAGIALMEIVSKPDMRSSTEAMLYIKKLRTILKYVKTCDCNMEQGNFRVDANVSVHKPGEPFGTRCEIKNLNSVRFVGQAIDYEIQRQISAIESGEKITQDTLLFDEATCTTRRMRSKEDSADYRYFPDPDLKPLILTEDRISKIKDTMPELPDAKKERFVKDYGITEYDADILTEDIDTADIYEATVSASKYDIAKSGKQVANWFLGDLFAYIKKANISIDALPFPITNIAKIVDLTLDDVISISSAKKLFADMVETNQEPDEIVKRLKLAQITDISTIEQAASEVLNQNPTQVEQYKSGKEQLFGFFVGMTMKKLGGAGNPGIINEVLKKKLSS